jgi:hypothetical protein
MGGIQYDTWVVKATKLTQIEKEWLAEQNDLKKTPSNYKPVAWFELCAQMAKESNEQGRDDLRPLHHSTLGLAWNLKEWQFDGQMDRFPIFDKNLRWKTWIKSEDGVKWREGTDV